jgi:hypothetical protein
MCTVHRDSSYATYATTTVYQQGHQNSLAVPAAIRTLLSTCHGLRLFRFTHYHRVEPLLNFHF